MLGQLAESILDELVASILAELAAILDELFLFLGQPPSPDIPFHLAREGRNASATTNLPSTDAAGFCHGALPLGTARRFRHFAARAAGERRWDGGRCPANVAETQDWRHDSSQSSR